MSTATRATGLAPARLAGVLTSTAALVVVVTLGALARLLQYLAGSSLSGDESFLALNLVSRSYGELFNQLDYNQVAPQLLLVVEKLGIDVFGRSEGAVRLVPFVAGVAALALFPALARRVLPSVAVLPAVALVAFSDPLVAWTVTNKQYAVDVLATIVVLYATARYADRVTEPRVTVGLAALGALAVWLSFASAFVLAGAGAGLLLQQLRMPRRVPVLPLVSIGLAWAVSFALSYVSVQSGVTRLQHSLEAEPGVFLANDGAGAGGGALAGTVRYVLGIPVLGVGDRDVAELVVLLALAFAVVGAVAFLRGSPVHAMILLAPITAALVAAAVGAYPLLPRAALWSLPILALLVARGIVAAYGYVGRASAVVAVLAAIVLGFTIAPTARHVIDPRRTQEMGPLLAQLARETTTADRVFVYYKSQYGLRWYLACDCGDEDVRTAREDGRLPLRPVRGSSAQWAPALASVPPRFIVGQDDGTDDHALKAIERLSPQRRTWVVLSNLPRDQRAELLAALDARGTRLRTIAGDGDEGVARAYLYDLSRRAS